jgi:hypothetical protein
MKRVNPRTLLVMDRHLFVSVLLLVRLCDYGCCVESAISKLSSSGDSQPSMRGQTRKDLSKVDGSDAYLDP